MLGRLKCCVEPSYTENAGSVEKKSEITVHVYKNKIKVKNKIFYCLYSNILYISTMTLDKAGDYIT